MVTCTRQRARTANERAWPGYYSKLGRFQCAKCLKGQPSDVMPACFRCDFRTWNGHWRGLKQLKKGCGFVCCKCWLDECEDDDRVKWARWFSHRVAVYPKASPEAPEEWKLQICPRPL